MIRGIGIDICAVDEIASMLENCTGVAGSIDDEQPLRELFTQGELDRSREHANRPEHLAGIFAAKEAVFKAFDIAWDTGVALNEIEIEAHPSGQPHAVLKGRFAHLLEEAGSRASLHLAISHDAGVAVAAAVLEGERRP